MKKSCRFAKSKAGFLVSTALLSALTLAPTAANAASDAEISELKAQIEMLLNRVNELEKENARQAARQKSLETKVAAQPQPVITKPSVQAAAPVTPVKDAPAKTESVPVNVATDNFVTGGSVPGSFKLPGTATSIKIGGYVKADLIYDVDNNGGAQDVSQAASIALDGAPDNSDDSQNFRAHTRQTRLNIATYTPSEFGTIKTYFEGDFLGSGGNEVFTNSNAFRIRHAYGEVGGFLAGQTWSNFMDLKAFPETIDFTATAGKTLIRQGQLRYTGKLDDSLSLALALENPSADFEDDFAVAANRQALEDLPDVTAQLLKTGEFGHLALRGVARQIKLRDIPAGAEDTAFGYGFGLSGKINVGEKDDFRFDVKYGDGIGRYIFDVGISGGAAAFEDATASLQTQKAWGGYVGYRHWWADNVRSNVYVGYTGIDNAAFLDPTTVNRSVASGHANLIWDVTKRIRVGGEVIYMQRETEAGAEGSGLRTQLGAYYFF